MITKIDINKIRPDPNQPRKVFSEEYLKGLSENLKTEGIINPIEIDKDGMIITGECRWRAAKKAGWDDVPVNVNANGLSEYKRFRRQMSENLHQSSAGDSVPMNPMDVANAYRKMLEMKGYKCDAASQPKEGINSGIRELGRELGISDHKIRTYLNKLWEPEYVKQSIMKDPEKFTSFDEARKVPEKHRKAIKKAIAKGKIEGRSQVRRFAKLAKVRPEKAEVELARITEKQTKDVNRIVNKAMDLSFAMKSADPSKWNKFDKNMARKQLLSTRESISTFFAKLKEVT